MKISNIKSLEKHSRTLREQIKYCKSEQNTPEEINILQELETDLNRVSGYLNNLRVLKNSPPALVINFLNEYIEQNVPALARSITFEILDEKRISAEIQADFLGYNLALNENYDPINEEHVNAWEQLLDNRHRRNNPNKPFIDRLNQLDKDFNFELNDNYESMELMFEFNKVHSSPEVIRLLWSDVMREVIGICNLYRNRQGLDSL